MTHKNVELSDNHWLAVQDALPGLANVRDIDLIRSLFHLLEYSDEEIVPTDGMYVVLGGIVSIQLNGQEVARAAAGDYFYEEYLTLDDIGVSIQAQSCAGSLLATLPQKSWATLPTECREDVMAFLFGDLVNIHMHHFQQPINCCNITAAALSLTALGYPTHVDDIFRDCNLPAAYVVNTGLTLGEMYDVACTYIYRRGLREQIEVQCHYFDEELTTEHHLLKAIQESDRVGGEHDILVANFGVGIAHGDPQMGGGHFALIAKCNTSTGLVHMMDVHPEKYGKLWVTTVQRLYHAMVDKDSSSLRARGIMRFSARDAAATRLSEFQRDVTAVDMTRHVDVSKKRIAAFFQRSTTNLRGLGALSLSIRLMGRMDVDPDELMRAANLPHSEALSYIPSTQKLARVAQNYLSHVESEALMSRALTYMEDDERGNQSAEEWLLKELGRLKGDQQVHAIINVDINKLLGCSAISQPQAKHNESVPLKDFWCVCTDFNPKTQIVTITDVSSSTSQVWQTPFCNLYDALEGRENPTFVSMVHEQSVAAADLDALVHAHPLVLFHSDDDSWSYMLKSMLSNIGVTDLHIVDIGGLGHSSLRLRQQLISESGKDSLPYLYFQGRCLGETEIIVQMIRSGALQEMLQREGFHALSKVQTPSLDNNIFGYPKGGLTEPADDRKNVLLCACGSSAADKIPQLIDMLVASGHDVKLVPSASAEHFFKDFGMEQILGTIKPSDIYRDDDEWNFRYEEFGMPVRAAHLALCDWADCIVVAPVTCNTMGKIANGVADSMLTSVFVAWQYQRKPVILCPACNTHMWNNITTQHNVAKLKRLGAHFEGPRSGLLSNGTIGTGMMALPEEILSIVQAALGDLENQAARVMRWGAQAAAANDHREWLRVYRSIDEDVVGVNIRSDETGDTLLHYAAGGEGAVSESGIEKGIPDIEAARDLIERGIDLNILNDYNFTALHVAIMNDSAGMVKLLLDAGADASDCLGFVHQHGEDPEVIALIENWAMDHGVVEETGATENPLSTEPETEILYFTYGSLKHGFPNHPDFAHVLNDKVGTAITRQAFPLIVPNEPNCENPDCPFLHRLAALVDRKGMGQQVHGEVYRVTESGLLELDQLEGYKGPGHPDNFYDRKSTSVLLNGKLTTVQVYFISDAQAQIDAWQQGGSTSVGEYTLEMAKAIPKP